MFAPARNTALVLLFCINTGCTLAPSSAPPLLIKDSADYNQVSVYHGLLKVLDSSVFMGSDGKTASLRIETASAQQKLAVAMRGHDDIDEMCLIISFKGKDKGKVEISGRAIVSVIAITYLRKVRCPQ